MIATIVSGLIYTRAGRRVIMELFPPTLRKLWKEWDLRVLVLLSLILQMILIVFGNRRKFNNRAWLGILLWCSYLMADWVATVALGVLSNNLGDVLEGSNGSGSLHLDVDTELTSFWAPFLLLHLGGPDTVTAYAMEDNELWLRHLLGLGVQTGVAIYIFILAWMGSSLSALTIPMIVAGLIKYGERTWALRSASNEQFRDSMLTSPEPGPNYPKFMQEYSLRQFEGYHVRAEEVIEVHVQDDVTTAGDMSIRDAPQLIKAFEFFETFKPLFVDLILSFEDREKSQSWFTKRSFEEAFKVIEIELGFMFDILYTKAPTIYSFLGGILRFITMSLTCIVLVLFSVFIADKQKFSKFDLAITFLLLGVAILLEIYAVLLLLSSDWTDHYLSLRQKSVVRRAIITSLQLPKPPRWSNSLAQYSLLSFCLKTKSISCYRVQKLLCIKKTMEKHLYKTFTEVPKELKTLVFDQLKRRLDDQEKGNTDHPEKKELKEKSGTDKEPMERSAMDKDLKAQSLVLQKFGCSLLKWSTEVEFDRSILIWHIATDLCYYGDGAREEEGEMGTDGKASKLLSQYMLYLLVMHPSMLPMGIGNIRYRDTCAEATKYFEEQASIFGATKYEDDCYGKKCTFGRSFFRKRKSLYDEKSTSEMLLSVNTDVPPAKVKGDRSKSVLFDACRLAQELQKLDKGKKWKMMREVWVEMLADAASQCRGFYHAQQLRRGGEFLTHVWLLMAHLGLTDQFQISQGHARAKLIVK